MMTMKYTSVPPVFETTPIDNSGVGMLGAILLCRQHLATLEGDLKGNVQVKEIVSPFTLRNDISVMVPNTVISAHEFDYIAICADYNWAKINPFVSGQSVPSSPFLQPTEHAEPRLSDDAAREMRDDILKACTCFHSMGDDKLCPIHGNVEEITKAIQEATPKSYELSFDEFSRKNAQRADMWHQGTPWSNSDWFTATVGELGELGNLIKKLNRIRDGLQGNSVSDHGMPLNMTLEIMKEIGGAYAYLDLLARNMNVKMSDCVRYEFNRVSERNDFDIKIGEK